MVETHHFANSSRTMPSGRYAWVTDPRPVGIDSLLHYSLKREENDPHEGERKLELLDTGFKSFSEVLAQVSAVVEGPVDDLELMRIDLCADIQTFLLTGSLTACACVSNESAMKWGCSRISASGRLGFRQSQRERGQIL